MKGLERLDRKTRKLDKWLPKPAVKVATAPIASLPPAQPGQQQAFLDTTADIAIFGGAAFGGKTVSLLLDFARPEFLSNPEYGGVIFRRTYPQVTNEGGLWDEAGKWYPAIGGKSKISNLEWGFPSGATVRFAHLQHENNIYDWQGSQLVRLAFDELTHFTSRQFFYLLSRNRSTSGIKPQIRATCNPDADSWVADLIDWWLDDEGFPLPDRANVVRWFIRLNDEMVWGDSEEDLRDRNPGCEPKSFTFIPAKISDNPIGLAKDPGYLANLMALHPVDQARLLYGNWKAKFEAGRLFDRAWFEVLDTIPNGGSEVRFWDLAATAADFKRDACYTAGVKMRKIGNIYYIVDVIAQQVNPAEGDRLIQATALQDGRSCLVRWELEGGSAGLRDAEHLKGLLQGYNAGAVRPLGDKITRSKPVATEAQQGRVKLLRGGWNDQYLGWLQQFPDGKVKDPIDATSGAFCCSAIERTATCAKAKKQRGEFGAIA